MKKRILFATVLSAFALIIAGCNSGDNSSSGGETPIPTRVTTKFLNYDDTVLYVNTIPYGQNAEYKGEIPKKPSDQSFVYTFAGWDKSLENIVEDTNFYAQYSSAKRKYDITFLNYDGEVLETQNLEYGSTPIYGGVTPTKPSDSQYSYSFSGWYPEISIVNGNATYQAQYSSQVNFYEITWVVDGAVTTETYKYGDIPTYKGETQKPSTAQYSYEFTGWSPAVKEVTGDATYTAQYDCSVNKYTITWLNYDGSVISSNKYEYGSHLSIADPSRPNTAQYSYEFTGWIPEMVDVTGDATYTAQYKETVNSYTITWVVDGNVTQETYSYGAVPSFKGSTEKESTAEYTYEFTGWSPLVKEVTGDATYTAQYSSTKNSYKVTWKNWDGTVLCEDSFEYGIFPTYSGLTPTKEYEELYYYDFIGWSPTIKNVTSDIEYTAVYQKNDIYEYDFASDNSECYITKYKATIENLVLPSQINNVPVTTLKSQSFKSSVSLKSVVIPNGILSIENLAFSNCSNLESVSLPSSLISIGDNCFSECSSIKTMNIPDSVQTIGFGSFKNCVKLDTLTLPFVGESQTGNYKFLSYIFGGSNYQSSSSIVASLKKVILGLACRSIAANAFYNCSSLKEVLINSNDIVVNKNAFIGCSSLVSVSLGNEVNSISNNAFSDSDYFDSFTIPENVTSIGSYAFSNCKKLKTIIIPDNVISIGDFAFDGCSELESVVLGVGVKSIGSYAFRNTKIKSIVFPNGLETIGSGSFYGCSLLESISIPDSVNSLGSSVFGECTSLKNISLGTSINEIPRGAFILCSCLESISIPNTVQSLGDDSFYGCNSLSEIVFPDNLTSIGKNCFSGCTSLTELFIPNSVISIGSAAFERCSSLSTLSIPFVGHELEPSSSSSLSDSFFSYVFGTKSFDGGAKCGYIDVYVPTALETVIINGGAIVDDSFYNFPYIKHVIINSNTDSIGQYAFYNCSSLETVELPTSIKMIKAGAFSACTSLNEINIPDGLERIDSCAFENCSSLPSITIPNSVTTIGHSAFSGCSILNINIIAESIEDYFSLVGREYLYGNVHILTTNNEELVDITIPNSVGTIPNYSFNRCGSIESVVIENGVNSIGASAFANCTSLKSIVIPDTVSSISEGAFSNCPALTDTYIKVSSMEKLINMTGKNNLVGNIHLIDSDNNEITNIVIPNTVTSLSNYAFYNCNYIQSVVIPSSVTSIGHSAFKGCASLETITIPFTGSGGSTNVVFAYLFGTTENIPSTLKTVIISEGCTSLPDKAFYNCTSLVSIVLPSTINSIGYMAFYGCTSLTSIAIPEGMTKLNVSGYPFTGCTSLTSVTLPSSLTSIIFEAFKGCTSLTDIRFNGTIAQWNAIQKGSDWNKDVPATVVHCSDGDVSL